MFSRIIDAVARHPKKIVGFACFVGALNAPRIFINLHSKRMTDQGDIRHADMTRNMLGNPIADILNPGIRVLPHLVPPEKQIILVKELRSALQAFGYDMLLQNSYLHSMRQLGELRGAKPSIKSSLERDLAIYPLPPPPNGTRATGRKEAELSAPWDFAASCRAEQLPPSLREVVASLREANPDLGSLRSVSIELRDHTYFRADLRILPRCFGEHVYLISLLSPTVLTFSPFRSARAMEKEVTQVSWSLQDIDVLLPKGGGVHLCGAARNFWSHGVRQGLPDPRGLAYFGEKALAVDIFGYCPNRRLSEGVVFGLRGSQTYIPLVDWFGKKEFLIPREPERIELVLSFSSSMQERFARFLPEWWVFGYDPMDVGTVGLKSYFT